MSSGRNTLYPVLSLCFVITAGGVIEGGVNTAKTQILTYEDPFVLLSSGPDLPFPTKLHCMATEAATGRTFSLGGFDDTV